MVTGGVGLHTNVGGASVENTGVLTLMGSVLVGVADTVAGNWSLRIRAWPNLLANKTGLALARETLFLVLEAIGVVSASF